MHFPKQQTFAKKLAIAAWVAAAAFVLGILQPTAALATSPLLQMTFQFASGPAPITIPLSGTYTGLVVDWGDGTVDTFDSTTPVFHDFTVAAPTYQVTIQQPATGSVSNFGQVGGWTNGSGGHLVSVESWSGITSFRGAFMLTDIRAVPATLPPGVTDTSYMFASAKRFNGNVSSWNTSSVTNMSHMFEMVEGTSLFNQPLNSWDVSHVTNMSYMFDSAAAFNQPLDHWQTGSVNNFSFMFHNTRRFNANISTWNTSAATSMESMFELSPFSGDISLWDVTNVQSMKSMFDQDTAFGGDLSGWVTTSLSDASYAFAGATSFYADLSGWRTPALTNLHNTFDGTQIDFNLASWDVRNVIDVRGAFAGTSITAENYSSTLIGWANQAVQPNLVMDSLRNYVEEPATVAAISTLEAAGWTFIGDSPFYPVSFDLAGAIGGLPIQSAVPPGSGVSLPDDTGFSKAGFNFVGWTNGGTPFAAFDTFTVNSPGAVLIAVWSSSAAGPSTYAVTFDIRGGSGTAPAGASYVAGATVVAPGDGTFSKTGFSFQGWSDGTTVFHAGDSFLMPASAVTLSAQWVAIPPPVTPASPPIVTPPVVTPPVAPPVVSPPTVATLAPDPEPITISLDTKGATGDVRTTYQILPGASIELPGPATLEKPGFALDGWSDGKTFYPAGSKYVAAGGAVHLQAQWRKLKLPQTIPTAKVRAVFYAGMKLSLPKLSDAGLPVEYVSANPADLACTTSPDGSVAFGVGDICQLIASQRGDENYLAATDVHIELNVGPNPSKVRKILFKFVGNRAVLTNASKAQIRSYSAYVKSLIADEVLHVRINVRNYYQPQGTVTNLSTARKAAMRKALVAAGLPLDNQPANLDVHLYFSPGYHARYSWASAPEVRVIIG